MKKIVVFIFLFCCSVNVLGQEEYLSDIRKKELANKGLQKAKDFGTYIEVVSDQETSPIDVRDAIELSVDLFMSEENVVAVSSLNREEKLEYPIRTYLNRLDLLEYSKVEVGWFDVQYIGDVKLGADGKYYGTITIYQRFRGYTDGILQYEDITKKNIEIRIERIKKYRGGQEVFEWDVFLGDISVVETF